MTLEHMRRFVQRTYLCKAIKLHEQVDFDYGRIDDPVKFRKEQYKYEQYTASVRALKESDAKLLKTYISGEDVEECRIYKILSTCTTLVQFKEQGKTQREIIQFFAAIENVTFFQASKIVTRVFDIENSLIGYVKSDADSDKAKLLLYRVTQYLHDYFNLFHKKELGLPFIAQLIPNISLEDTMLRVKYSITKHDAEPPHSLQSWRCDFKVKL